MLSSMIKTCQVVPEGNFINFLIKGIYFKNTILTDETADVSLEIRNMGRSPLLPLPINTAKQILTSSLKQEK